MFSAESLRDFINERLAAAAAEIFTEVERRLVQYGEELDQRRLLVITWEPQQADTTDNTVITGGDLNLVLDSGVDRLSNTEVPQQHVCKEEEEEEEVLADMHLCSEKTSSLDQIKPEPFSSHEEEQNTSSCEVKMEVIPQDVNQHTEEIHQLHRRLDINWNPQIILHRIDLPEHLVCKEKEVLSDQQFWSQERKSSLDQDKPEPPQFKEEQEELFSSHEEEQLELNQDTERSVLVQNTSRCEAQMKVIPPDVNQHEEERCKQERSSSQVQEEPELPQMKQREEELCNSHVVEQETETFMLTPTDQEINLEAEPNTEQLYSQNFPLTESSNQQQSKNLDLVPTTNVEINDSKRKKCGKTLTDKDTLQKHRRIHKRHLKCETCGKDFRYNSKFNDHLRTHTGEKPHCCGTCGRSFTQRCHLLTHMKIHTGERPHSCGTCGRSFTRRDSLSEHMKIHTGEKPHSCGTCGKSFTHRCNLLSHMKIHIEKVDSCETIENK